MPFGWVALDSWGTHLPWPHLALGGCLFLIGISLVLVLGKAGVPSFLRDALLVLGLALPLAGGALFWDLLLPPGTPGRSQARLILVLAASALSTYAVARFVVTGIRWWGTRSEPVRSSERTLTRVARLTVLVLGLLVTLEILEVPITPILTTLGVGSLAVALALQETLANFFAGLHIAADHLLKEGDHIKLSSGEEGVVLGVGWRSARLRSPADAVLVIPNAKLAQASITNFDVPGRGIASSLKIPVSYGQDPRRVRKLLEAVVGSAVGTVEGVADSPKPQVSFEPGFGEFAMEFTMTCHLRSIDDEPSVRSELRARAWEVLRGEGIELVVSGPPRR